jgi:hypothetical protein
VPVVQALPAGPQHCHPRARVPVPGSPGLPFAIAYRMLGSVSEAEDVVQEALLRVHQALDVDEQIASPRASSPPLTTWLAINDLRCARARRERYVGEWPGASHRRRCHVAPAAAPDLAKSIIKSASMSGWSSIENVLDSGITSSRELGSDARGARRKDLNFPPDRARRVSTPDQPNAKGRADASDQSTPRCKPRPA